MKLKPGQHPDTELVAAARVADPDPWRDRLRAAHQDPTALRALADDEPGLEVQPAISLMRLAIALRDDAKDWDRGARVLRLAWRRFPNDFWTNLEMSRFMTAKIAASPPNQRGPWNEERVRYLTAAVASRPASVHALSHLGDRLVELGRFDGALEAYRRATRLRPGTAPYTRLGQVLRTQKKVKEAEAAFREAIQTNPDDAEARAELGTLLREQKKLDESVAQLHEATRLKPESAIYHYYYGWSLDESGRRDEAIAAFREAVRLDSARNHVGNALGALANDLRRAGRTDAAIAVVDEALRIKPDEMGVHEFASHLLTQQGRWAEALKHVDRVAARVPAEPLPAAKIAVLRLLAGDDAGYRRQCLAMLDRFGGKGRDPTLYAVQSCMLSARPVEVERAFRLIEDVFRREKSAKKAGNLGYTQLVMALADYRNGRFAPAADLAKELRGTGRRLEIEAEIILAMASHRLGDKELARQQLASATKAVRAGLDAHDEWDGHWLDWLSCDALLREAKALIGEGSTPEEGGATNLAVAVDYPFVEILLRAGRVDEAIAVFGEALLRKPDDARAQKSLGHLLAQRGRWEAASKALDKAFELDPSDAHAGYRASILHLYLGDDAGYRRHGLALLDRFADTWSGCVTMGCLLSPRPVELERVSRIARRDYESGRTSNPKAEHYGWAEVDWALAEYRGGHFDRAADHLKRCRSAGGTIRLVSESLLAMTCLPPGNIPWAVRRADCSPVAGWPCGRSPDGHRGGETSGTPI